MRLGSLLVFAWLIIGAVAAGQRDYFTHISDNCADFGTIGLTVLAGPLNYTGLNPKVTSCDLPQPSS